MKAPLKSRAWLGFVAGLLLGALIWWASPLVTGEQEPWDAPLGYYVYALVVAGFTAAWIWPSRFWLAALGVYVGQCVYALVFLPGGPLWMVGLVSGLVFSLFALLGATIAFVLSRVLGKP
jgi:hypothetical protein